MKQRLALFAALVLALGGVASCKAGKTARQNGRNQSILLKQEALYYYWNGNDYKKAEKDFFQGVTIKGNHEAVERLLLKAYEADKEDLALLYGIASSQIMQGKIPEALKTYRQILNADPAAFAAGSAYALYTRLDQDEQAYNAKISWLAKTYPKEFAPFGRLLSYIDNEVKNADLAAELQPIAGNTVIVALGYALNSNGEMEAPLIGRLEATRRAALLNPEAPIIVSGGVPKQGVTESYLMKQWLVDRGIGANRIFIEDQSKDTVGNAVYSMKIIENLQADQIILISSATHLRRAMALFKAVSLHNGYPISKIIPFSYMDFKEGEDARVVSRNEELVIYRDALRAYGFWAFPGIQQ